MEQKTIPLSALSPSAARLLLALASARESEELDVLAVRAGIKSWKSYWKAKQQLLDGRYLRFEQGKLKATLTPR